METNTGLVKLDQATRMLAEIESVDDAKHLIDLAEAARVYAKQVELGLEAQNHAAEIKLRAQRRAGEILDTMERRMPGETDKTIMSQAVTLSDAPPTYDELGINRMDAHRWQTIAKMPEETFEGYIEQTKDEGKELTTAGAIRTAKNGIDNPALYTSDSEEWYTPASIIERTVQTMGAIDLDPCSNSSHSPNIPAARHYTKDDDGLCREWTGRVYMNPPYGREIIDWIEHLVAEYRAGRVSEAIALVPSRTDTEWFRMLKEFPRCFVWGRLHFSNNGTGAPFPSMVVYLGQREAQFIQAFEDTGDVYRYCPPI